MKKSLEGGWINPVIAIDPDGNDVMLIPGGVRFTGSDAAAMFKTLQAASSSFIDQEFEDGHVQQRVTGYDFKATWKLTKVDKEGKGEWVEKYHFKMSISFQMTSEINFLSYKTGHYSFFGAKFSVMWSNNFFAYRKNDRIDYDNGRVMVSNPREPNMPGRWMDDRSPALNGSNIVVKGGLQTVSANIFQIGEGYNPFGKRSLTKYFNAQVPDFEFNADFVIQSKREWNEEYFSLFDQMNSLRKEIADDGDIPMPKGRKRLRRSK